jgi:hypothetical protein
MQLPARIMGLFNALNITDNYILICLNIKAAQTRYNKI